MKPLRALLLQASSLLFAGLACAAPQHAVTLYNEPPKYPANFQHFDYVNPDAPKGGIFRQGGFGGFDSLNPFISKGVPADDIGLIYDTLAKQGLDEPFTEYGLIAEKIEKAPDNGWVRFYLRPEARFNDGHPVRAEDVVFSFQTLTKDGAPMFRGYYNDVAEVIAEDPLKVLFKFKHTQNRELPLILGQLPVLPKHWWAERDFNKGNLEIPLGSGPYKVAEVKAGRSIRYERVKDYWGKDLPVNRGKYNYDRMDVEFYRDSEVAFEAFKAGEFDIYIEHQAKNWANGYQFPAVNRGDVIKAQIPHQIPTQTQGLFMNTRRGTFAEVKVREALGLMFDFEWTNRTLFSGAYKRTLSYYPNSEFSATGLPVGHEWLLLKPYRDQLPPKLLTEPFSLPKTDGRGIPRETLRKALGLLKEAGWNLNGQRLLNADHQPLSFEILLVNPNLERILQPYVENLASIGVQARLRTVDRAQYKQRLDQFDFDMILLTLNQTLSPGLEQWQYFHSSQVGVKGSKNYAGIANPVVDHLLEKLLAAQTRDEQVAAGKALDRVLLWQQDRKSVV